MISQAACSLHLKIKRNQLSSKYFFASYCVAFFIPLLMLILYVQSNYITHLQDSYQKTLQGYADELRDSMDEVYIRMVDVVHSIVSDKDIMYSYAPNKPVQVIHLATRLQDHCNRIPILSEIVVFGEKDDYLFSNVSSYHIDNFSTYRNLIGISKNEDLRRLLIDATPWQVIQRQYNGRNQLMVLYPWKNPSNPARVFVFVLDEGALINKLRLALKGNSGSMQMLSKDGVILAKVGKDGGNGMVARTISKVGDFTYVMRMQSGSIIDGLEMLRKMWYLFLFFTLGLGILEAIILSRFSIQPIRSLRRKLVRDDNDDMVGDDFHTLYHSIEKVQKELDSLQKCSQAAQSHFTEKLLCNDEETTSVLRILTSVYQIALSGERMASNCVLT